MTQYATAAQLSGLFKETYADEIMNLIPDVAKLVKMVPFKQSDRIGNYYHQPVVVSGNHGITFAAAGSGAYALNTAISMTTQDAQIQGAQFTLRSQMAYETAARAASSKVAFVNATELLVESMMEDMTKYLEISFLYGGSGLGLVSSGADASGAGVYATTCTISAASWASGIWAGMEGAQVNFYHNSSGVSSTAAYTITSVSVPNQTITVSAGQTDNTALQSAITSYPGAISIYFLGAHGQEPTGLATILSNTGSLFNISASQYSLWAANQVTVTGQLTMGKILSAVSLAVQRGLNEKCTVLVNPQTWANLASDLAALREFDSSYKSAEGEDGFESLKYHGQNGVIEVISHNCVKAGDCFIVPVDRLRRIGAVDITFQLPGRGDEFFMLVPGVAAFELQCHADQALFLETPARAVYVSGFTNV